MECLVSSFFSLSQVNDLLLKYLKKIAFPFHEPGGAKVSQENIIIESKLARGLTILVVFERFQLPTSANELAALCSLLCLDEEPLQAILAELCHIKKVFVAVDRYVPCGSTLRGTNGAAPAAGIAPVVKQLDSAVQCQRSRRKSHLEGFGGLCCGLVLKAG